MFKEYIDFLKEISNDNFVCKNCGHCCNISCDTLYIPVIEYDYIQSKHQIDVAPNDVKDTCIFLKNKKCGIYNYRPVICRIYNCKSYNPNIELSDRLLEINAKYIAKYKKNKGEAIKLLNTIGEN